VHTGLVVLLLLAGRAMPDAVPRADGPVSLERSVWTMGTVLRLRIGASSAVAAEAASEAALEQVAEADDLLSTWRLGTALSELNQAAPGASVAIPLQLAELLRAAESCTQMTRGGFDPGVGKRKSAVPDASRASPHPAGEQVTWTASSRALDAGGFGKGAALDMALARVAEWSAVDRAVFDFGGQIAIYQKDETQVWTVVVADPRDRSRAVLELDLSHSPWARRGSVSTSGNSERGVVVDGTMVSHIIDPRTGIPTGVNGSTTVLAESAFWADCLSTGLYVLGAAEAHTIVSARPATGLVSVQPTNGRLLVTISVNLARSVIWAAADVDMRVAEP